MRRLPLAGLFLASVLLLLPTQAGAAKSYANHQKRAAKPIGTLAMDGSRVAHASGGRIRVWNVTTGATSVVKDRRGATHDASQLAISGKQVAWIRTVQHGNTELDHWLYTAWAGGAPHVLRQMHGYTDTACGLGGPQMDGLVGSGRTMAVSTWLDSSDGSVASKQRLSLIAPTRLRTIVTGPNAIVSEAADDGHIAVLPTPPPSMTQGYCQGNLPTSADVYSTDGALLKTTPLPPSDPSTLGYQLALSGNELVVLTYGLYEPSGPAWVTLTVYDWTTGAALHTWPVRIEKYPGEVSFAVHGQLAAVEGPASLHLVDLTSGKDVVIGPSSHTDSPPAIDARGLVYAVTPHFNGPGKLVFVPTAKLLAAVG